MIPFDSLTVPLCGKCLIEASAGTGKTYAIASLYLRLVIEQGLAPENILVVTFTDAATKELRDRIRQPVRARRAHLRRRERLWDAVGAAARVLGPVVPVGFPLPEVAQRRPVPPRPAELTGHVPALGDVALRRRRKAEIGVRASSLASRGRIGPPTERL